MNTSAKGRRYEYKAKEILEKAGYLVLRSAASKGPFDLVGLIPPAGVRLIQVKVNVQPAGWEEEELFNLARKYPSFSVECWIFFQKKGKWIRKRY